MPEIAVERRADGTPVDPELMLAEREGRLTTGRPIPSVPYASQGIPIQPIQPIQSVPTVQPIRVIPTLNEITSDVHQLQAASEGIVVDDDAIEFCGETFKMGEKIGLMPLLKFAHVSSKGVKADDMEGLAAMYALIKDCIAPGEWERFEQVAIDKHADDEDLLNVVSTAIETLSARPTKRRSVSSAGSPSTSVSSKVSSSRPAPEGLAPLQ